MKTTVDELAASLSQVVPTAAAMGVSFDQVSAAMATLTSQGIPTAQATTQMNSLLAELGKEGTKASDTFKELSGKSFQEFIAEGGNVGEAIQVMDKYAKENNMSLLDMFSSIEAGKAGLALASGEGQKFAESLDGIQNGAGATEEAAKEMETATFTWNQIQQGINKTFKELSDFIMPAVNQVLGFFRDNIDIIAPILVGLGIIIGALLVGFGLYAIAMGTMALITGGYSIAVGAVSAATSIWTAAQWLLNAAWLANPITWIVLGIIAAVLVLIGVFILLKNNWDNICSWFNTTIDNIRNWFGDVGNFIAEKFSWCWDQLKIGIENVKGFFSGLWEAIKSGAKACINGLIGILNLIPGGIEFLINGIIAGLEGIAGFINVIPGVNIDFNFGRVNIPRIPSLAIGTNFVNSDGLANIHKGEMIVPADVVKGGFNMPNSNGGGNNTYTINIDSSNSVNPQGFEKNIINSIDNLFAERGLV